MEKKFKSGKINLVYWNAPNFGDKLSPYLVGKLSGQKIIYKSRICGFKNFIKRLLRYIVFLEFNKMQSILFGWQKNLLCIGSILNSGNKHSVIWGSGFMHEQETFRGGIVCAVRGKYTNNKLKAVGFTGTSVYGDPALLMPILISPSETIKEDIAIIPHWSETEYFIEKYGEKYKIIDLRTEDIKRVIMEITSCRRILSTSLHGIIVSHAYGIPALWIKYKTLHNSNFKFYDYFSSVGIEEYEGYINIDEILSSEKTYVSFFGQNSNKSLPNIDIKEIQRNLLSVAPFDLKIKI